MIADLTPAERRFWKLVDIQWCADGTPDFDKCWPWKGCRTKPSPRHQTHPGYGQFRIGSKRVKAHRHAYELWHGEAIPAHLDGAHITCDNPPCCNPTHVGPQEHTENWRSFCDRYYQGGRNGKYHARRAHPRRHARRAARSRHVARRQT